MKKKIRRLSRGKVLRLVETFEGEIDNGGFDQFFHNSIGKETAEIIQALEIVGASKFASLLKQAAKKFPGSIPPRDRGAREELLQRFSPNSEGSRDLDQEFYACEEDIHGLLEKYLDR